MAELESSLAAPGWAVVVASRPGYAPASWLAGHAWCVGPLAEGKVDVQEAFQAAVARSRGLPTQSPAGLLALYGLYKQATEGDATGARPGLLDVRGRAKFDAWAGRAGQSREAAMKEYIETVDRLGGGTD